MFIYLSIYISSNNTCYCILSSSVLLFISDMESQTYILDLPNEILRNYILTYIPKDELFWNVGFVCTRLMLLTLEMCNNAINISIESLNGGKNRRSVVNLFKVRSPHLKITSSDLLNAKDMIGQNFERKLKSIFLTKEIGHLVTSFKMNNTSWESLQNKETVLVNYHGKFVSLRDIAKILTKSTANLMELSLDISIPENVNPTYSFLTKYRYLTDWIKKKEATVRDLKAVKN